MLRKTHRVSCTQSTTSTMGSPLSADATQKAPITVSGVMTHNWAAVNPRSRRIGLLRVEPLGFAKTPSSHQRPDDEAIRTPRRDAQRERKRRTVSKVVGTLCCRSE